MNEAALAITTRRIYVVCPANLVTGGPELLHQLVHELRAQGREAFICYFPFGQQWRTPPAYERYGCPAQSEVPDEDDCAVIVPETLTVLLRPFRHAQPVIWWLSVDHYLGGFGTRASLYVWLRRRVTADVPDRTIHLCQSHYAREFVERRFGDRHLFVSDYIAQDYHAPGKACQRRDVVAFNPSKGKAFTRRLIASMPDVEFVALQGMSRSEMRDTLDACKLYIDFGGHPGKDRIPREAALRGAVVLVGRRGSAACEDVPIAEDYKIARGRAALARAQERIREILSDYPRHRAAQDGYRVAIAGERIAFSEDVRRAFSVGPA